MKIDLHLRLFGGIGVSHVSHSLNGLAPQAMHSVQHTTRSEESGFKSSPQHDKVRKICLAFMSAFFNLGCPLSEQTCIFIAYF